MDPNTAANTGMVFIQSQAVRACELRLERRITDATGHERVEYLCGASGGPEYGYVLVREGEDLSGMLAICNHCPIPDALASRRSCLNLVPVRCFPGGKRPLPVIQQEERPAQEEGPAGAYFACRWFLHLVWSPAASHH